jgi:hypothetical protein
MATPTSNDPKAVADIGGDDSQRCDDKRLVIDDQVETTNYSFHVLFE